MSDPEVPYGPKLVDGETLHRVVSAAWWVSDEAGTCRVLSSQAFSWPCFSVDRAKLASVAETLARFRPGSGLAAFVVGDAHAIGFDCRDEADPDHPDNLAHAHVYGPSTGGKRKSAARRLATQFSRIVVEPTS